MREYTTISVDPIDLMPQVLRELLAIATDPNYVEVTDSELGRVIHAHPQVADAWYEAVLAKSNTDAAAELPTSASPNSEDAK